MDKTHVFLMLLVIAAVTAALRALPFLIFRSGKQTPEFVSYLGKTLPFAIMGMLVVFCLRNTAVLSAPYGAPELLSLLLVIGLQIWRRNSILSIVGGTVCYMALVNFVFPA